MPDLAQYHQQYKQKDDLEIKKRAFVKTQELAEVIKQIPLQTHNSFLKIAVLGCGDRRFIRYHLEMFENIFDLPVEMLTLDITLDHLAGVNNVFQHDCTQQLPYGPFDTIYSHVLLRFIQTDNQWEVLENSYAALKPGGLAIHVLDTIDYTIKDKLLPDGYFSVPLRRWEEKLKAENIIYKTIPLVHGVGLVLIKPY